MLKYHIQTIEAGSSGLSAFIFSNLPQIYDDLEIHLSLRSLPDRTDGWNDNQLIINGSTANISMRNLFSKGNGEVGSNTGTSASAGQANPTNTTPNVFSSVKIVLSSYLSNGNKPYMVDTVTQNNSSNTFMMVQGGLVTSTSPVTSLGVTNFFGQNFAQYSSASLYGIRRGADRVTGVSPAAEGGTITTAGGYTIHTFNASGTFKANRNLDVEYLVIAGGGGGGMNAGGGGGAGGYRSSVIGQLSGGGASAESRLTVTSDTSYPVVIGAGGAGGTSGPGDYGATIAPGLNGSDSIFGPIISTGGGGGGAGGNVTGGDAIPRRTGKVGGSGGGSTAYALNSGAGFIAGGAGTANQGFAGGSATSSSNGVATAGGGGAGGAGQSASAGGGGSSSGSGGLGLSSNITGTSVIRASGGSAWQAAAVAGGGGGSNSINGTANTGGGGGDAGIGGSGVVIIRYLTPA